MDDMLTGRKKKGGQSRESAKKNKIFTSYTCIVRLNPYNNLRREYYCSLSYSNNGTLQAVSACWSSEWLNEWVNETLFPVSQIKTLPVILQLPKLDESSICILSDSDTAAKEMIQSHIYTPGPFVLRRRLVPQIDHHLELESEAQIPSGTSQIM